MTVLIVTSGAITNVTPMGEEFCGKMLSVMPFPIKVCVVCSEEFELRPDKPGFANRCPACSEPEDESPVAHGLDSVVDRKAEIEVNAARRKAIRDLLYRGDN